MAPSRLTLDDLLLEIEAYFGGWKVGSNPKGNADGGEGKRLLGLLNGIFADVGEDYCSATGDIPMCVP